MIRATPRNLVMLMAALFGGGGGAERLERKDARPIAASTGPSYHGGPALGPPPWSKRLKRRRRRARAARQTKKARSRRR